MDSNVTYTRLLAMIPAYQERQDTAFLNELPSIINLAENRIATDMKQQGFQSVVTTTLPLNGIMAKPSWWKETISFNYTNASGQRVPLFLRNLEYCRNFAPTTATGIPRFYADYNVSNFLIVATPPSAYAAELVYYARLQPLDSTNDTNWLTLNAPQVLFYACMLEANVFLKNDAGIQRWQGLYQEAKGSIQSENQDRMADRTEVVTSG